MRVTWQALHLKKMAIVYLHDADGKEKTVGLGDHSILVEHEINLDSIAHDVAKLSPLDLAAFILYAIEQTKGDELVAWLVVSNLKSMYEAVDFSIHEQVMLQEQTKTQLRRIVKELKTKGMHCDCDLDKRESDTRTGHSQECRIHQAAIKQMQGGTV